MGMAMLPLPLRVLLLSSEKHQEFQVPKMEVLSLIRLFWGWVFPYISRIHTAYIIGEDSSILGTNELFVEKTPGWFAAVFSDPLCWQDVISRAPRWAALILLLFWCRKTTPVN